MEKSNQRLKVLKHLSVKDWLMIFFGILIAIFLFLLIGTNQVFFQFAILLLNSWLTVFVFFLYKRVDNLAKNQLTEKEPRPTKSALKIEKEDEDVEKTLHYKEKELTQIELDKTIIFEELLSKTNLREEEKQTYRKRLSEKESEAKSIQQELALLKTRIQQKIKDGANLLLKRDPVLEKVVQLLEPDFILKSSFDEIDQKLKMVLPEIESDVIDALMEAQFLTEQHALTRIGYRELIKTAKKGFVSLKG
ncbi:hypothetical protein [Bacillus alveayuensis]|uniref:Ca2+/Na+ antiporter n=1 Tax=Aeribacillus alveayuensis TaxID=279215 RepID=A0ABT9VN31_9BACI|nr:hypothetical protein [Bacillus alveayuensis]MDQ0162304.1 Ca2+/Na+ antiporter [Bacillus alveayuensis]